MDAARPAKLDVRGLKLVHYNERTPQVLRVRSHAHRLLAAGNHYLGVAIHEGLIAERNRPETATAELVNAPGRTFYGDTGDDRGLAGRVLPLRRGQYLTHDDFRDTGRLDARALQRGLDSDGAEVVSRRIGKGSVETSDRGAGGADDDDIV